MEGVPGVYIEGSFRGHKVSPGTYTLTLKYGDQTTSTKGEVVKNPRYDLTEAAYAEYHEIMQTMEGTLNIMHTSVNELNALKKQVESAISRLDTKKHQGLITNCQKIIENIKSWDSEMVQRKSKAYDDVENFPNKLSANYLFLINQSESDVPQVTKAVRARKEELDAEWMPFYRQSQEITQSVIDLNQKLWEAGVGAIPVKSDKP